MAERRFREDLFFRLSVMPITVPPLRERGDDVALLAQHFLERHAQSSGRPTPVLDDGGPRGAGGLRWPGNVRELQNCLERAAILCDGGRDPRAAPAPGRDAMPAAAGGRPEPGLDLTGTLAEAVERAQQRRRATEDRGGARRHRRRHARAAELLGVPFRVLVAQDARARPRHALSVRVLTAVRGRRQLHSRAEGPGGQRMPSGFSAARSSRALTSVTVVVAPPAVASTKCSRPLHHLLVAADGLDDVGRAQVGHGWQRAQPGDERRPAVGNCRRA